MPLLSPKDKKYLNVGLSMVSIGLSVSCGVILGAVLYVLIP